MDPQLLLFKRQYLQLVEPGFLIWPPKQLLRNADAQSWLFKNMFDPERNDRLPPERYQLRVLKPLLTRIEQSIEDPEEDVGATVLPSCNQHTIFFLIPFLCPLISSFPPSDSKSTPRKYQTLS